MNEPIINPWIFYLIEKCATLHCLSFIIAIAISIGLTLVCSEERPDVFYYSGSSFGKEEYKRDKEKWEQGRKQIKKRIIVVLVIGALISFLAPSKETMYKMLIAQQLTKQNIEVVKGNLNDALDNIVEKIIKVKNETSKER